MQRCIDYNEITGKRHEHYIKDGVYEVIKLMNGKAQSYRKCGRKYYPINSIKEGPVVK